MHFGAICPKSVHFPPRSSRMEEASPRGVYAAESCNGLDRGSGGLFPTLLLLCCPKGRPGGSDSPKYFGAGAVQHPEGAEHVLTELLLSRLKPEISEVSQEDTPCPGTELPASGRGGSVLPFTTSESLGSPGSPHCCAYAPYITFPHQGRDTRLGHHCPGTCPPSMS